MSVLLSYPDPDTETTTCDGGMGRRANTGGSDAADWSDAQSTATAEAVNDSAAFLGQYIGVGWRYTTTHRYILDRIHFGFDTSSIPDTDDIANAIVGLFPQSAGEIENDVSTGNDDVFIVQSSPASNTALATGDYDAVGDSVSAPTHLSADTALSSLSGTAYNEFTLNTDGKALVSTTGVTNLGMRVGDDITAEPSGTRANNDGNRWTPDSAEETGTSKDPYLYVAYGAATADAFYPDPDPEFATVDGDANRNSNDESWSAIRTTTGEVANDSTTNLECGIRNSTTTYTNWRNMHRAFLLFDTSSLPDTDTIDATVLSVNPNTIVDQFTALTGTMGFSPVTTTPASNTAIATGDYLNTGTTAQASEVTIGSLTVGTYADWTFNATGRGNVSKTGVSKFGISHTRDMNDDEPTEDTSQTGQNSLVYWSSADNSGTTIDPVLVVSHTAAATQNSNFLMFL